MITKKNKGFTLIEMISVLLIISVITVILTGKIINSVNKQKNKISDAQKEIIYEATNEYMSENEKLYEDTTEGKQYCISLETLVNSKKLSLPLKDINTGKEIELDNAVKVTLLKNENYEYEIMENSNCDGEIVDKTPPTGDIELVTYTDQIEVTANCKDAESDISKYEFSIDNGKTWINNQKIKRYIFKSLTSDEVYKIKVRCTNGKGMKNIIEANAITKNLIAPEIIIDSTVPSDSLYYTIVNLKIKFNTNGMKNYYYYYKSTVDTESSVEVVECGNETEPGECGTTNTTKLKTGYWYKETTNNEPIINFKENGSLYAVISDGTNIKSAETFTISKIDTTGPSLTLGTVTSTTNSITIPITKNEDKESGIKSTTCVYGTSTSYGSTGTISSNNCNITGLKNNTTYYYKIVTTNNAEIPTTKTGNITTGQFGGITITQNSTDWTTSKTVTISGTTTGAQLQYQVGSKDGAWTNINSGGTITITENTTVYARLWDGKNESEHATLTVTTIDTTSPGATTVTYNGGSNTCSWKNNYNITLSSTDNVGIAYYEIDHHGNGTVDETTGANFIPPNGWSTCTAIFRAVDHAGNRGPWTNVQHIHMDTQAPGTPNVTYNSGSNTCTWKNNYNYSLLSSDNIGIAYYEIDWDGDGNSNTTTGANFIPWNGYSSCYTRFRAVDHAGNRSGWTGNHHIHMDTQAPNIPTFVQLYQVHGNTSDWESKSVNYSQSCAGCVLPTLMHFVTSTGDPQITFTNKYGLQGISEFVCYIRNMSAATTMQIYYSTSTVLSEANSRTVSVPYGNSVVSVTLPTGNYYTLRLDLGNAAGLSYDLGACAVVANKNQVISNNYTTYARLTNTGDGGGSGFSGFQYKEDNGAWIDFNNYHYMGNNYYGNDLGSHIIYFRSVDNAGNVSGTTSMNVYRR